MDYYSGTKKKRDECITWWTEEKNKIKDNFKNNIIS